MEAEQIKQLATDVNNVAEASFQSGKEHFERPLLAKIEKLEVELIAVYEENSKLRTRLSQLEVTCTFPPDRKEQATSEAAKKKRTEDNNFRHHIEMQIIEAIKSIDHLTINY